MTPQAQKKSLRQRVLTERDQLTPALRSELNTAINQRLATLPEYRNARTVLCYMNIGSEFASEDFARQVLADGKILLLPRTNLQGKTLELYRVQDIHSQLAPGAWGIREPIVELCARVLSLNAIEFILLPGVAFTRTGARLGYGGGFYDRLLADLQHRPPLVAGAFSTQVVQQLPQEATDRKVEWLVTEKETIRCT